MSKETEQYLELIRQHAASAPTTIKQYCLQCGHETRHTVEMRGDDEVYTCKVCQYQVWYRVR